MQVLLYEMQILIDEKKRSSDNFNNFVILKESGCFTAKNSQTARFFQNDTQV